MIQMATLVFLAERLTMKFAHHFPITHRTTCRLTLASATLAATTSLGLLATASVAAPPVITADAATPDAVRTTDEQGTTVLTGSLASGATWEARVPEAWNGTLILYGHGFRGPGQNPAWDSRMDPTFDELARQGYAVAASSYATTGWALGTAVQDQLQTFKAFGHSFAQPQRTIAFGRSMGGLVTSLIAEVPGSGVDAAVSTCGLVGGGASLNNYQLDAAYAASELLLPGQNHRLTGFTSPAESAALTAAISEALAEGQKTAEGRARVALVAALLNTPTELDGVDRNDPLAMQEAQARLVLETLPTVISRRSDIVNAAGGDSGWTAGVDYNAMLMASPQAHQVRELYRMAGLDLKEDLGRLTANADIEPSTAGLGWMLATSVPTGELQMPVLSTHTLVDLLAPVEYQEEYAETIRQSGAGALIRQAFVDRDGHCNFSVAETLPQSTPLNTAWTPAGGKTRPRPKSLMRQPSPLALVPRSSSISIPESSSTTAPGTDAR